MDLKKHLTLREGIAVWLSLLFVGTPARADGTEKSKFPASPSVKRALQAIVTVTGTIVDNSKIR